MQQGLRLLKAIIHESSSKLAIAVCAFVARKVQGLNRENAEALKKVPAGQ
jgi:proteasome lid subunit RPN8/RPN11